MSSRSAHIPTNRRAVTDLRARPSLTLCFLAACFMSAILRPFRRLPPSPRARPAGTAENLSVHGVQRSGTPLGRWPRDDEVYQRPVKVATGFHHRPSATATRRRGQGRFVELASHGWPNTFPKGAPLRTPRHPDRPPPAEARHPIFRDSAQSTASCNTGISSAGLFEIKSCPVPWGGS